MRIMISCVSLLMILLGVVLPGIAAGAPSSWQVGSYWTYQELQQVQSFSAIPMGTITYYVVARVDLLDATLCALTRVDKSPGGKKIMAISPLTIHVFNSGTLRPQVWPFPAQGAPLMVVKKKGSMLGEGCSQTVQTVSPVGDKNSTQGFNILQDGVEKVTVPAGVFPNAIRFNYHEKVSVPASIFPSSRKNPGQYSWQAEGTAWWSSDVAGWVRIEEHGNAPHAGSYAYTLVLSDWGRLSEKDLRAQLKAALKDIASVNPVMAVMIGRQFQEIGLNLSN